MYYFVIFFKNGGYTRLDRVFTSEDLSLLTSEVDRIELRLQLEDGGFQTVRTLRVTEQ